MFKRIFAIVLALFIPLGLRAATDGSLGATSTGVINISLTINTVVQITNVKDVNLSYVSNVNSGDLENVVDLCIYTNSPSGNYRIMMTSQNAIGTAHRVIGGNSNGSSIPYEATWFTNSQASGTPADTLRSGIITTTLSGAHTSSNSCNNGTNNTAAIKFRFLESDLMATPGGNYSDVITIVVSPI